MAPPISKITNTLHWTLTGVLTVAVICSVALPGLADKLDPLILVLAALASITALTRQLPVESVAFAALVTALIGGAAHGLTARTGLPFGPVIFNDTAGPKLFNSVPWTLPLLWVVVVFNSRGVARLVLRPWRKVKNYGFWLIGFTAFLVGLFDLALEPFAGPAKHFWRWQPTKLLVAWHGASPMVPVGWLFISLVILGFVTPYLIKKQPGRSSVPDFAPLLLWLGALVYFALAAGRLELWTAVALDLGLAVCVAIGAYRGARW